MLEIIELSLAREELVLLNNSLNEITGGAYAIPDSEFQTLTGSTKNQALDLLKKISVTLTNRV